MSKLLDKQVNAQKESLIKFTGFTETHPQKVCSENGSRKNGACYGRKEFIRLVQKSCVMNIMNCRFMILDTVKVLFV